MATTYHFYTSELSDATMTMVPMDENNLRGLDSCSGSLYGDTQRDPTRPVVDVLDFQPDEGHQRLSQSAAEAESFKTTRQCHSAPSHRTRKPPVSRIATWMLVCVVFLASVATMEKVEGFTPRYTGTRASCKALTNKLTTHDNTGMVALSMVGKDDEDDKTEKSFDDFGEDEVGSGGVMLEDLNWRVNKMRLEEANTKRFLKSKPRFLPYEECSKWVQAFGRWRSEEDW